MADHVGLGEIFKVSNKGDGSYFEGERNDDDELLFEHSLRKSWKLGTIPKYSETIEAPSGKEINYIEVIDNEKDGTNGERDVTVTAKTAVRVTITGVFGRGVNWDIRVYARPTPKPTPDVPEPYAPLYFDLGPFMEYQDRQPSFSKGWTKMPRENPPVLCVVTTADPEYEAVVARLEPANGHDVVLQVAYGGTPMLVGKLGNYQVALLQTHVGAYETKKALLQVLPSLSSVRLVLAIGFGYGLHPALESTPEDGQMIGDVMVSATCFDLSTYRATKGTIYPRGAVTRVKSVLANTLSKPLFEGWTRKLSTGGRPRPPTVHVGTYLSLPVLFDSEEHARPFVQAAAHYKPIGGDFELFQIISAIGELGHPATAWLAIKSICDFGGLIKKSKDGQPLAAATAVDFTCYFLSIPGLLDRLLEPTQDKNDMLQEISGYIDEMEQLIEDYENVLQPLPQCYEIQDADFNIENAYSRARRTITWFKGADAAEHKQRVSADRVYEIRKQRDALMAFCREVIQRPFRAAALICVEDLRTAAKRISPLLKPLGSMCVPMYYRPDEAVFARVRRDQPFVCLLVGCYEKDANLTEMKRLRLWNWNSQGEAYEMQPKHVADFMHLVRPVCTLLVADGSDDLFAELMDSLLDGTYLIAWKGNVTLPLYEKFMESFLGLCLSGVTEGNLHCVESAYVQSVLKLTFESGATRPAILHPCSQTVTELLSQQKPKRSRILVSVPVNLLDTSEQPSLTKILNLISHADVQPQNLEKETRMVIDGIVSERDKEEMTVLLEDLEYLGVKVERFPSFQETEVPTMETVAWAVAAHVESSVALLTSKTNVKLAMAATSELLKRRIVCTWMTAERLNGGIAALAKRPECPERLDAESEHEIEQLSWNLPDCVFEQRANAEIENLSWSLPEGQDTDSFFDELTLKLVVQGRIQRFDARMLDDEEAFYKEFGRCSPELDRRVRKAVLEREMKAAIESGYCLWKRSRLMVVGQGGAGKTSLVKSLHCEGFDRAERSTAGIQVHSSQVPAEVRDVGVWIRASMANEQTWYEDESTGNELRRALRTSAAAAEASPSPGFESSDAVIRHLQSKFGIGDARKLDEASMLIETSQPGDGSLDNQGDETADATAAETLTHGRAADAPALRPHTSQQTEVRSIAPPRDSADNEGVTHMGVLVVDDDEADNAGKILVSVWDFGGQPVFQVVQHLYMPRIGVYAVVFRLIDLLLEPEREAHQAALKYLDFWLHSIDTYATYPRREEREIRFPPIVLVGTYLDDLAKQPEEERLGKLRQVNGVLLENFKNRISCLQADQSSRIKGREFLYNEAQDLCYFPVDNTIDDDKNVRCLREVIVRAIKEDALQYIHDPIPTSWLRVFDKLETVRDSHPRLAVHEEDDDDDEDSVVQLMLEAGALSREDPIEARKSRAVAMLQYFHFFGAVVYFDDVPGLQHHALIGPQWVLDSITFVVRDFRLHRFRRDRKAMDINDGKDWLDLISNGIATEKLLRRLWIGERLAYDFLVSLMIQLGLFARLSDGRFLVPSSVCATTIQGASNGEPAGIQAHLDGSEMRLDGRIPCFEFQDGFLPNGFFERVVNKLVNDWPTGAAGEALVPELRASSLPRDPLTERHPGPNAAFLHLQSHPLVILKAWPTIRVYIRLGEAARRALEAVDQAVACVSREHYAGHVRPTRNFQSVQTQMRSSVRRSFSFSETLDDDPFFGWRELAEAMISERELLTCELAREEIRDLYDFFKNKVKPKGKANVAAEYTKRILSERSRANLEDLKYMQVTYLDSLNKDKDNHLKPGGELEALLQDCEIKNADQWKIWRLLHQNYRIVKGPGPFLFGIFAGAGLDHLRLERVEIGNLMSAGCLGFDCKIFDELTVSKLEKALDNGCGKVDNRRGRVLHFAMHGTSSRTSMPDTRVIGAEAKSTRTTLQVYGDDLKVIEAEPLARIVAKRCTDEQVQFYDNNFECVFLNCCESDTAARKLKEFNVPWVLSWTTPVDDEAAKTFAEGFYRWLAGNPGDYKGAFEKGKKELTDHLWIIEDPTNSRCGQKSGIPRLRGPTNPKYLPPPPEPSTLEIKDIAFMKETLATLHKTFLQYLNAELQYPKLFFVVKFPTSYGLVADRLINEQLMVVFVCEKTKKRARYEVDGKDVGGLIVTAMKPSVRKFIKRVDDFWHRFGPIVKITAALVVTAVKATTSVDLKEFVPSALMETSKDSKGTHDFITRYAEDAGAKVDESLADGMVTEVATAGLEAAGIDHSTLKSILPAKGFEQIQNMKFNRKTFLEFGDFLVAAGYDRKCLCMDIDTIGDSGAGWIARDVDRPTQRVDDLPPQKKVMKTIELTKKAMKEATERTDPQRADVERVDDFVDQGLDVTLSILSTGRALPLISEACGVAGAILKDVQKYKDKADDVVQAGRRVLDVLEFLRLLTSRVRELSPESTSEVRAAMADITQLLEEFKTAVEKFGKPGFFKRFWKQREYAGTLSRLDGEIRDKLDFLTNAYGLARDAQVEGLPRAITYKLEEALEKYVDERHDKDERALENAAKEGGVDAEETTMALVALHQKVELEKDLVREMAQSREYGRHEVLKQALGRGSLPWRRSRLMVVGEGRVGKTCLVRRLKGEDIDSNQQSARGAETSDVVVTKPEFERQRSTPTTDASENAGFRFRGSWTGEVRPEYDEGAIPHGSDHTRKLRISIWDYGGCKRAPNVFQVVHNKFLSRKGVYLVVFKVIDWLGTESIGGVAREQLVFWLNSISIHASGAPLLLVGTYCCDSKVTDADLSRISGEMDDLVAKANLKSSLKRCEKTGRVFYKVDNLHMEQNDPVFRDLRIAIEDAICSDSDRYIHTEVPFAWLQVCDELQKAHVEKDWHFVGIGACSELLHRCYEGMGKSLVDETEVYRMLSLFDELGVMTYFGSSYGSLAGSVVILDPQWIVDMFTAVIRNFERHRLRRDVAAWLGGFGSCKTYPASVGEVLWHHLTRTGILDDRLLDHLWPDHECHNDDILKPEGVRAAVLEIMEGLKLVVKCVPIDALGEPELELVPQSQQTKEHPVRTRHIYLVPSIFQLEPSPSTFTKDRYDVQAALQFEHYLPDGLFSRLVASLIPDCEQQFEEAFAPGGLFRTAVRLSFDNRSTIVTLMEVRAMVEQQGSVFIGVRFKGDESHKESHKSNGKMLISWVREALDGVLAAFYAGSGSSKLSCPQILEYRCVMDVDAPDAATKLVADQKSPLKLGDSGGHGTLTANTRCRNGRNIKDELKMHELQLWLESIKIPRAKAKEIAEAMWENSILCSMDALHGLHVKCKKQRKDRRDNDRDEWWCRALHNTEIQDDARKRIGTEINSWKNRDVCTPIFAFCVESKDPDADSKILRSEQTAIVEGLLFQPWNALKKLTLADLESGALHSFQNYLMTRSGKLEIVHISAHNVPGSKFFDDFRARHLRKLTVQPNCVILNSCSSRKVGERLFTDFPGCEHRWVVAWDADVTVDEAAAFTQGFYMRFVSEYPSDDDLSESKNIGTGFSRVKETYRTDDPGNRYVTLYFSGLLFMKNRDLKPPYGKVILLHKRIEVFQGTAEPDPSLSLEASSCKTASTRSVPLEVLTLRHKGEELYAPLFFDLGPFEEYQDRQPSFSKDWIDMPRENPPVLCVVTTADLEYKAVVARLKPAIGHNVVLQVVCGGIPMLVGKIGNYQVAILQTRTGAVATREALLQVLPSLLSVRLVIAIGFGYGLHPALASTPKKGQMIGDVMVSATCFDLSTYTATEGAINPRGPVTSVKSVLANTLSMPLFEGWSRQLSTGGRTRPPTVHFGTYLSLPVLFDSEEHARPFVEAAAYYKPIGGDMELFQIISAIGEPGHPTKAWLAIKSICDFGGLIKRSEEGQPLAAATAVDFACYFLSIPRLLDQLFEPTWDKNDMLQEMRAATSTR